MSDYGRENWNDRINESAYAFEYVHAIEDGFTRSELSEQNLSNPVLKTRSKNLARKFRLAYWLGILRGIRLADEYRDKLYPSSDDLLRQNQENE